MTSFLKVAHWLYVPQELPKTGAKSNGLWQCHNQECWWHQSSYLFILIPQKPGSSWFCWDPFATKISKLGGRIQSNLRKPEWVQLHQSGEIQHNNSYPQNITKPIFKGRSETREKLFFSKLKKTLLYNRLFQLWWSLDMCSCVDRELWEVNSTHLQSSKLWKTTLQKCWWEPKADFAFPVVKLNTFISDYIFYLNLFSFPSHINTIQIATRDYYCRVYRWECN